MPPNLGPMGEHWAILSRNEKWRKYDIYQLNSTANGRLAAKKCKVRERVCKFYTEATRKVCYDAATKRCEACMLQGVREEE